jgi:hypothetical protein
LAALTALGTQPAAAGHNIFHIFTPAIEAGAWGVEAISAFQSGFPADGEHEPVRMAHELAVHTGVNEYWMTKIALGLERPVGGDYEATAIASENTFRLFKPTGSAFDVAMFGALELGIADDATNAVAFGPILSYARGPVAIMINPFFEKSFGRNREDGVEFTYGWRATYQLSDLLSVGVEGYGAIENISNAPPTDEQIHRIGPVLYLGHVHGNPEGAHGAEHHAHEGNGHAEWHAEIGVLFGMTDATPDTAIKFNIGADF